MPVVINRGHSPIRAILYAKEPDLWNKGCQVKSADTGFRRCLLSWRGIGTNRLFALIPRSGFFYSQYAGHGGDQSAEALTSLEVGQFASRLDSLLLNVQYRTNRRVPLFNDLPSAVVGICLDQVAVLNDVEVITPDGHALRTGPCLVFTVLIAKGLPMAVKVCPHQVRSLNDIEVITPSCHAGRTSPYLVFTVLIAKGFPTAVKGRPYEVRFLDD